MRLSFNWLRILWITFVLALPGFIIYSYFPKIFACPSCYIYEWTGDGLKNYYTLDYYVKHDDGWHFSGMNYPYGENIIYTDNQPLLAMVMRFVDRHIFSMDRHVVGTLNMLLLLSIYLGVIFTYLLLRRWEVGRWWALGSAVCMTFLSPQLWRLHGHYGLAYVFFIPVLLLLLDSTVREKSKKWLWAGFTALFVIAMSLTHMYFLLLSTVVIFSFMLFWWYYNRKNSLQVRSVLPWLIGAVMLPGLFLVGLRKWTDHVTDRPIEPWGLDDHTLSFESTFFPFIPPLDKAWTVILKQEKPINERVAYVGLIGLLMLPAIVLFLFRKKDENQLTPHIKAMIGAAIITWCMGAGIIYQHGFKFLW